MQKIKAEEAPKLAAHQDAIYLNPEALRARQGASTTSAGISDSTPSSSSSSSDTD